MARSLRIEYPGAWYHFTCRGNERCLIFKDDADRREFLNILKESLEKYKVLLHGYVLMENHFHLILHTPQGNLNRFAQRFNTAYTVYFNRRHSRTGHLYHGRYKAILVEKDSYLLALLRYIHLNPVKIKKLKKLTIPEQIDYLRNYKWSSNRGYGLLRCREDYMCYEDVLGRTGGDNKNGRNGYREFVEEGLLKDVCSPFEDIKGQVVLGKSGFVDWVYEKVLKGVKPDKAEQSKSRELVKEVRQKLIIDTVCGIFKVSKAELIRRRSVCRDARMVYIDLCCKYRLFHKSLREIGQELGGLTVGGMSQTRKRLRERMQKDNTLRAKYVQCNETLNNV
ncbi:MAG: transposase [Candidatus Scalindua sp.]